MNRLIALVARRPTLWGAIIGASLAAIAMYVYLNTAAIEVQVAGADGIPLWSWYQAPFVIPEAMAGGLVGAITGLVVGRIRSRPRSSDRE